MEKRILCMLTLVLMSIGLAKAQKVLLPFGQSTQQPWTAKYYFAKIDEAEPANEWFAKDFDDSSWESIEGPMSTANGLAYFATPWNGNYTTYWVRRHFTVSDLKETPFVSLYIHHDDGCEVYLNGWQIYSSYYNERETVNLTEEMCSHFIEGDNVIAVKVSDTGGGEACMDFGLEANNVPPLVDANFDNGYEGWVRTGDGYSHGGQSFNYLSRYLTDGPFDIHQTINVGQKGLFRVRAQAFEANNNWYIGCERDFNNQVVSYLYAGDTRHSIKSIYEEALYDNIYDDYYKTLEKTFVPTYMTSVSYAFQNGMYENEFYVYIDTLAFDLGLAQTEELTQERWVCFDNFRVEYMGEKALATLVSEMESVKALPMESTCQSKLTALIGSIKAASSYEEKARLIAASTDDFIDAKRSSAQYALIKEAVDAMQRRIDTGTYMAEATVTEAQNMIKETTSRYQEGTIAASECQKLTNDLNSLISRLNYTYIHIVQTIPGSLGDTILNKVENFADVISLKISGTLDDADLSTIKERLTQMKEIDMTGVKMTEMPNELFYKHSLLETVKLPVQLTTIGDYAFYECKNIRNIDFPATLTTINRYAFAGCENLEEIILPEGVTTVGYDAFSSCRYSHYLKLPSTLKTIESSVFQYNERMSKVDFAEGLTHINDGAFYNCSLLNNLKFPKSLYYIGNNAFGYNSDLSDIEFNEGLYQIGDNAFYDCDALTEVTLPSSLVLAYQSPFDYCDNLKKVTCLSIVPPHMTDQIPYGLNMDGRELYVPALSINTYKQTTGWDKFQTIKPIDSLPDNIAVACDFKLTLPETIPADYKPSIDLIHDQKGTSYWQYGSLTVNGEGTLSLKDFKMFWDPNYQYVQYNRNQNYCSLITNSHLRADNVAISLWARNDIWTFLSLPFDVKMSDIYPYEEGTTNWVVRKYDGQKRANGETADTWVKMTADDVLHAYEGFIIQGSRYIGTSRQEGSGFDMPAINNANKNNIFTTTDITLPLKEYGSEFAHNRSWNLIGNPYPCYYDTRFMDFEAPITVWNMRNSTYTAYSPADDSYILLPGEAFFVQCPVGKESIVFGKDGRQTNRDVRTIDAGARAFGKRAGAISPRTIINLCMADENHCDQTRIVLNERATLQYEIDKDASKFMSSDAAVPQLYTTAEGVNYAINERPMADGRIDLSAYAGKEGLYTISLANEVEGYQIILEDKADNKHVVLTTEAGYTFAAKAGTHENRFVLYLSNQTTGIEEVSAESSDDEPIYSIEGIRMSAPAKKGIYIQNGKKILLNK